MKSKLTLIVLFFVAVLQAQNLNITSSGETSSPGTNWSISGNTLNVASSGTANINPSVITNHLNSVGNLTVILPWSAGITRQCSIDGSITYTGTATRTLTFKVANDIFITTANNAISATNGALNVVLISANASAAPDSGRVSIRYNNTINTNGGHLWIGAGPGTTTWNGLTVGNGASRTYADDIPGLWLENSTLNTNGGNIYLAGLSYNTGDNYGTNFGVNIENTSISSGSGNTSINGSVKGNYTIGMGTRIYASSGSTTISSTSGTISITGVGDDQVYGYGYRFGLLIYSPSESNKTTISSVSGPIIIQGTANFASTINDKEGLVISGTTKMVSQTGNIELKGSNTLESSGQFCNSIRFVPNNAANAIRIGYDGTNTYSGNILIEGNSIYQRDFNSTSGSIAIQSTGNLTIQPSGNAFTYMRAGDAGTLTFDDDWNFGTTLGGFTFGKSTNTTSLTYGNSLTTTGTVTIYSGNTQLGLGVEIITTGTTGNINFLSTNGFGTVANSGSTRGRIITTGSGSIHINADYDNNNNGVLNIDWLTIDGTAGNVLLEGAAFSWNTASQVALPVFFSAGGSLTIRNVTNSDYSISTNWFAMFGTFGGVTLGREGGTETINLVSCTVCYPTALNYGTSTFQIAGPITALGGIINANYNLISTNSGSDILLKASKNIIVAENVSVQTNNGDITFWSNSEGVGNATDGDFIGIYSGVSINSANGVTNQTSGGGTITMAGGNTSQVLASGTVVPTGYAYSSRTTNWVDILPPGGVNFGEKRVAAGGINTLNIYSGGGDIVIKGKSNSSSAGVQWFSGSTGATQVINSGNGTISIDGLATSSDAHGIEFMSYSSVVSPAIISSNTSSAAISIKGETYSTNNRAGYQGAVKLEANGIGGGIEVNGKVASSSNYGAIESGGIHAYAVSGPITFISDGGLGLKLGGVWGKGTLPSSSSTITLRSDKIALFTATIETTGTVTVEPLGTTFTSPITFPISNLTVSNSVTGLTIGKSTNMANVTFANATTIAGPITVYGGDIAVNANLNTTAGAASGDVLLKASGNINVAANKSVTTTGGDATFWSDSDASGEGYVQLYSSAAVTTNNGAITMGGGTDPLTQYAKGVGTLLNAATLDSEFSSANDFGIAGVHFRAGATVNSGGGAITLNGQNKESAQAILVSGVFLNQSSIDSGAGKIVINGKATGSGSNAQALTTNSGASQMVIKSTNSAIDAITITGDASAVNSTTTSLGVNFNGTVLATNGGGILITGKSGTGVGYDRAGQFTGSILANSGPIALIGENDNSNIGISLNNLKLGAAATDITSSTSNITLSANTIVFSSTNQVNTSGSVAIEPKDASFVNALTFPITSLTLSSNVSGLTLGKPTNTTNITFANATTIAGPITAYGGDIAVNENLNTSGGAANGDVLLKASGSIIQAASKTVTTAGGDVTFWSDRDGNGSGYIQLTGGATSGIFSGGGDVVLGGGLDIATGYARGAAIVDAGTFDSYISGIHLRNGSTINSNGGAITLRGQNVGDNQSKLQFGITGYNTSLLAGTGKITLTGLAGGSGGTDASNAQAISSWPIYTAGQGWTIRSSNPDADAIRLIGDASPCNNSSTSLGINFHGTIESTGGGGIYMSGKASTAAVYDQPLDIYGNILANSGAITIVAENDVTTQTGLFFGVNSTIGSKAGTNVTSSTSTIILKSDNTIFNEATPINTSGTVSIVPLDASDSFGIAQSLGSKLQLNAAVSGLTVGKSTNTANVTLDSAVSINGPITVYGGTITANANLTTTNSSNAPILLQGSKVIHNQGVSTQTNGSDITYNVTNSPWTSTFEQGISLGTIAGTTATINAQGGNISITSSFASTGVTNTGGNPDAAIRVEKSEIKTSGSGTITINGNASNNASNTGDFVFGLLFHPNCVIQTQNGAISITGTGGKSNAISRGIVADNTAFKVVSASGPITFTDALPTGYSGSNYLSAYFRPSATNTIKIGADGTLVPTSTSNVVFDVDRITFDGAIAPTVVNTNGTVTIQPVGNQFDDAVSLAGLSLSNTATGLTIGKPTNTANVTFANVTSIAGPITAYGGTITLDANLTTTNNGAISLYSDNPLGGLTAARTLTAAGAFKYIPRGTAFTADVTYPITNLTATSTGLTIGKTTNDKNINITQDVTGGAGIELFGANVNINSNLKTTDGADMYLKGNTTIAAGKYIESNGDFTHDGNMTFKSDALGTAAFGTLGGNFTTISGTSTVERYIPAKRAYRFLSPSVTTTTSIRQNWQEGGDNLTHNLGTHITGVGGASNGFDVTATNSPSLFTFNPSTAVWAAVTNTSTNTLTAGTAYRLMVRGDRFTNLANNAASASITTLRATGALKTGDFTPVLNQVASGYSFVGNPYQAPVDIKAVLNASSNMNTGVVYYWDPTKNARGAYVTRTLSTVSTNVPTSNFTEILQPGQAVFVKNAVTGTPSMTFNEINKVMTNSTAAAGIFRAATTNDYGMLRVNLKANVNNQWEVIEGALAIFHPSYSWGVTQEDANKFSNLDEEVSFMQNNTSLAIAMQSNPAITDELPMKLNNTRYTSYQWQFELTDYNGLTPYLLDTQNNTYTQIDNSTTVPFTVNGQENTRFRIVFQNNALGTPTFDNQVVLYPNPASSSTSGFYLQGITTAEVAMHTLLGQKIPVQTSVSGTSLHVTTKQGLSKGVYIVSITQEGTTSQVKWIVE